MIMHLGCTKQVSTPPLPKFTCVCLAQVVSSAEGEQPQQEGARMRSEVKGKQPEEANDSTHPHPSRFRPSSSTWPLQTLAPISGSCLPGARGLATFPSAG